MDLTSYRRLVPELLRIQLNARQNRRDKGSPMSRRTGFTLVELLSLPSSAFSSLSCCRPFKRRAKRDVGRSV
jgi:hypothetical protein